MQDYLTPGILLMLSFSPLLAISSYHEDKEHRLKLTLGETVYIEEETDGEYLNNFFFFFFFLHFQAARINFIEKQQLLY